MSPTLIVGYLALFASLGFLFLFVNLLVGKFVRPDAPNREKLEIYECGEPTIGSSFVQFDLRFYVVALLFIIFDVEVAFFFPWAVVYGKAVHLLDPQAAVVSAAGPHGEVALAPAAKNVLSGLGVPNPQAPTVASPAATNPPAANVDELGSGDRVRATARTLALASLGDILVFFAVLMAGFAYVWRRGDLDWVRAVSRERSLARDDDEPLVVVHEAVLA